MFHSSFRNIGGKMQKLDLLEIAGTLPEAWHSKVLGTVGPARVKILRMNSLPVGIESHTSNEALLVLNGRMELSVAGQHCSVDAGQVFIVEANTPHAVLAGSYGALLIIDLQ